jgi:DNA-binding XRE family transcriptional regulator
MVAEKRSHPNSIVKMRGKAGYTIEQLASVSRIDEWTIRGLETGKVRLHEGHKSKLCQVFRCSVEELLEPCRSQRNPQIAKRHSDQNLEKGRRGRRWAGKLPIPDATQPLVRTLYELLNERKLSISDVARPSGIALNTISEWRYRRSPSVNSLQAVLNALGHQLAIVPKKDSDE